MANREHLRYITVLNVTASFFVIVLHCNACFWDGPNQGRSWFTANLIETLCYWPVPVFFMIPGITLIDYRQRMNTGEYLSRRVKKAFIPYIIWSLISVVWFYMVPWHSGNAPLSLPTVVEGVLNARFNNTYWFFPPLFALYASIPILSLIERRNETFVTIAVLSFGLAGIAPLACNLLGISWNPSFLPPIAGGYLIYIALGWLLGTREVPPHIKRLIYLLGIIGWLIHFAGTHYYSVIDGAVNRTFKGYLNVPAVLQASAVFLFFKSVDWTKGLASKFLILCKAIQPYTLGVYLVHWYLIDTVTGGGMINRRSILWRIIGPVLIYLVSIIITAILQRIPLVRRFVPR